MIRIFKPILPAVCIMFLFACTNEYSVSNPLLYVAKGTLQDQSGNCFPITVYGNYTSGELTDSSNYVQVGVHVTEIGTYNIVSDTVNGIYFKDTGYFVRPGDYLVKLLAYGIPADATSGAFSITFGQTTAPGCSFIVNVAEGIPAGPHADFTLVTPPGGCSITPAQGNYEAGVPLNSTNTITVPVNVTAPGSYMITTNAINGYKFTASGTFTTTGDQTVTLTGTGTPAAAGNDNFTPQAIATTGCPYSVNVAPPPAGAATFSCKINGTLTSFNESAAATVITGAINMAGNLPGSLTSNLSLTVSKSDGSAVAAGTYSTSLNDQVSKHYGLVVLYTDPSIEIWSPKLIPADNFTVQITSITATNVKGTFSGTIRDAAGSGNATKTITEGVFDLPRQ